MKLDKTVEPLPVDSTVVIRSRSALGLKYVQIDPRHAPTRATRRGSMLPVSPAHAEPVEFDEFLTTFDKPTRENIRANLTEFGNALAGRGPNINAAIGAPEAAAAAARAGDARHLRARRPASGRFFTALEQSAAAVAPVAADAGADVRRPRHDARRVRRRSPARTCRRRSRRRR